MLLTHRSIALPGSLAHLSTHALVHSAYRVHAVFRRSVISDDELLLKGFERRGGLGRPVATVLLEGRARLRWNDDVKWIEPGQVAIAPDKSGIAMRQEGATYRSVVVEWEPPHLGSRPDPNVGIRLAAASPTLIGACEDLSRSIGGSETTRQAAAIRESASVFPIPETRALWNELREAGVPLSVVSESDLVESSSDAMRELSHALDVALSSPGGMLIDLETKLSLSTRQLNRLVKSFNDHYAFNAEGWRDLRNRYRVMMAAALLTSEDATVDSVARAVGFTSSATLSRALANMGLPRPSEIRDATLRLGKAQALAK